MAQAPKTPIPADDDSPLGRRPWYVAGIVLGIVSLLVQQPLLLVVGLLIVALGVIPELWYRFCLTSVTVERKLETRRAEIGDEITYSLLVENRKLMPLPRLEVQDEVPEQGVVIRGGLLEATARSLRAQLVSVLSLWAYQRVTRRYRVRCMARGVYTFGSMRLYSGDPFGFLEREARIEDEERLVVYPLIVPVEELGLPSRAPFGDSAVPRRLLEDPLRIAGARDYVRGDEPRRIHWKATARAGSLQSKVYEPSTHHTLELFVDGRTRDNPLLGYDPARVELALCAAASVASWGLARGYSVGMAANGVLAYSGPDVVGQVPSPTGEMNASKYDPTTVLARVVPSARPEQLVNIQEALARLVVWFPGPITEVITREERFLPVGSTVVYIGAAPALGDGGILALERMRARGHAVVALLTGEEDLPPTKVPVIRIGNGDRWESLVAHTLSERDAETHGETTTADESHAVPAPAEKVAMLWEASR